MELGQAAFATIRATDWNWDAILYLQVNPRNHLQTCHCEFCVYMAWARTLPYSTIRQVCRLTFQSTPSPDAKPHSTASFRALLPANYEFVFVDAPIRCDPAPGVAAFYPGPYLCWYNTPTTAKVAESHEFVSHIMQEQGPFDAVMGFSQVSRRRRGEHFMDDGGQLQRLPRENKGSSTCSIDDAPPPTLASAFVAPPLPRGHLHLLAPPFLILSRTWHRCPRVLWDSSHDTGSPSLSGESA